MRKLKKNKEKDAHNSRRKIELIKKNLADQIRLDTLRFKRAVIREIDYQWRRLKNSGQEPDLKKVLKKLKLPLKEIEKDLKEPQQVILKEEEKYFKKIDDNVEITESDYNKIVASSKMDFGKINETHKEAIETVFKKAIQQDYSFERLRGELRSRDIGDIHAQTLAITSVAQFDNSLHLELAQQAGIEEFLWDGPPAISTSHDICIANVGKVFTLPELQAMDNGTGMPVETSLGGYNCRHWLTAQILTI